MSYAKYTAVITSYSIHYTKLYDSLTTLFTVVALVIFGMDSVREFAIPLMIGIISGGYSSALLTGPVWHFLQSKRKKEA